MLVVAFIAPLVTVVAGEVGEEGVEESVLEPEMEEPEAPEDALPVAAARSGTGGPVAVASTPATTGPLSVI